MSYRWPEQNLRLKFFQPAEFNHPDQMDRDFLKRLDELRKRAGIGIVVNSDYRTAEHNREVGGKENSAHLTGKAADIAPLTNDESSWMLLLSTILEMWREGDWPGLGLGLYRGHYHVDSHPDVKRPAIWVHAE